MREAKKICVIGAVAITPACGVPSSQGIPPKISDLDKGTVSREPLELEKLWVSFADAVGIRYASPIAGSNLSGKTRETLVDELSNFPKLLDDERFVQLNDKLLKIFTSDIEYSQESYGQINVIPNPLYETRCARIKQVTPIESIEPYSISKDNPLPNVELYKLEYFLKDRNPSSSFGLVDAQLGDQIVRTALITIPKKDSLRSKIPLALYGHGGASGLTYSEIAEVFQDLQNDFVIAAPSFPEEPICAEAINPFTKPSTCRGETISEAVGVLRPFDTDANEILGLTDCISRAVYAQSSIIEVSQRGLEASIEGTNSQMTNFGTLLDEILEKYSSPAPISLPDETQSEMKLRQSHPKTVIFGASRGAAASLIALAKSGASILSQEESQETLSYFQCAAFLFPPTTFTMGRLRIALELFVKGQSEDSIFSFLPTADTLADFFASYREGNSSLEETVDRYLAIDPLMNIHLIAAALRDWKDPISSPGRLALLHGRQDQVVGPENSQFFGQFMSIASKRIRDQGLGPGVTTTALSFSPPVGTEFPATQIFSIYQHGDSIFRSSLSIPDNESAQQRALDQAELINSAWNLLSQESTKSFYNENLMMKRDLNPNEALLTWLESECDVRLSSSLSAQ